jgi:hypothetical protein
MSDLRKAAEDALKVLESIGQMDMYPEDWAVTVALRAALEQYKPHEPWCASLTQLLMSNPPQPAKCNCREDKQ